METSDASKHLASDSQKPNDLCEVNVEATSSHVKAHAILSDHSFDSNSVIESLQFQPSSKSRFSIPLCRLLSMPLVRPTLMSDVLKLEQGFIYGYRSGSAVFYVSVVNNVMETKDVTSEMTDYWNIHWKNASAKFDEFLKEDDVLCKFVGKMFWVWDGNYRLQAWRSVVDKHHAEEATWHISVDSILLNPSPDIALLLTAMHDLNR
jgi:hypothetical protein